MKRRIVIADDDPTIVSLVALRLGLARYDVLSAGSGAEALALIRASEPLAAILDVDMPGGNGLSFLVDAREEYPDMQRVLVTGYMKPEMLLRSVNEAALYRYLLKPVSLPELVKTVLEAAKLHDQTVAARTA